MRARFTGLKAWWVQRVSAVYMLLFVLFLLYSFALRPLRAFPEWHAWMARPVTSVAFLVFFAALLGHMWVGLRDVLLDYARPAAPAPWSCSPRWPSACSASASGSCGSCSVCRGEPERASATINGVLMKLSISRYDPERDTKPYLQDYGHDKNHMFSTSP